jgi:hypothetical protein
MSYSYRSDDNFYPSDVTGVYGALIEIKRQLGDIQSTSARQAAPCERRQPELQSIVIKALAAHFIASRAGPRSVGFPTAIDIAERIYARAPNSYLIQKRCGRCRPSISGRRCRRGKRAGRPHEFQRPVDELSAAISLCAARRARLEAGFFRPLHYQNSNSIERLGRRRPLSSRVKEFRSRKARSAR